MALVPTRLYQTWFRSGRATLRPPVLRAAPFIIPFVLAFALYAPVLPLPYCWDDLPTYVFATTRTWGQLWTDASGLPYYRPLAYTLYKLFFAGLPIGAPFWSHVVMVAVHALNSLLVGQLAVRALDGREPSGLMQDERTSLAVALLASVLFVLYPFASLPVALFASLVHLLVTTLALVAALACLAFVRSGRRRYLLITLAVAGLAPCVHESGIIAGLLASLVVLVLARDQVRPRPWLLLWPPVMSSLFLPAWALVPKTRDGGASFLALGGWDDLLAKFSFFLQAPSYPAQPLGALLMQRAGLWDLGAILLAGAAALLPMAALLASGRRQRALALGLGWALIASLPSIVALPVGYIVTSPRLLYLPGVGAVLLWTAAIVEVSRRLRPLWLRGAALVLLAGLTVGVPLAYVQREVRLHVLALTPLRQLAGLAHRHASERHLVVNPVYWMSYESRWYPLGHDGVNVLTAYSGLPELIYMNSGVRWQGTERTFPELRPSGYGYFLSTPNEAPELLLDQAAFTAQVLAYDRVWLATYAADRTGIEAVGQVAASLAPPPTDYLGSFEEKLFLRAGRLSVAGSTAVIELDWLYQGPDPQATVFRNVFDCAGNVLGLGSGAPLGGMLDFAPLAAGTSLRDVKHVPLDRLAPDGCYQAEVGLFRPDGSRVKVLAPDGTAYENDLVRLHMP